RAYFCGSSLAMIMAWAASARAAPEHPHRCTTRQLERDTCPPEPESDPVHRGFSAKLSVGYAIRSIYTSSVSAFEAQIDVGGESAAGGTYAAPGVLLGAHRLGLPTLQMYH